MVRVLTIDGNRTRARALAMECLEHGVAVGLAETLCEGVRDLLDRPASLVLADVGMLRAADAGTARLFDAVAPGVPVVVAVDAGTQVEDLVDFELRGFHVVSRPFALRDLLAKVGPPSKAVSTRPGVRARVEATCG